MRADDDDDAAALRRRLRADLLVAMRARDGVAVPTLRSLIAALDNAQAVAPGGDDRRYVVRAFGDGSAEVPRLRLSAAQVGAVIAAEAAARRAAAADFARLGRHDRADALAAEAAIIARYGG